MNWKIMGAWMLVCMMMVCHVQASLRVLTDAERIEHAERIIIGTVEVKDDQSIITVEKVLKGAAEPQMITTNRKPERDSQDYGDRKKVLWVEINRDQHRLTERSLTQLCYIKEGSPKWLLYHALIDPMPLVNDQALEQNREALLVLGYLFDPLKITSVDAPMVAEKVMRLRTDELPWTLTGVLNLQCSLVPGNPDRMQVDSMIAHDDSAIIRHFIERIHLNDVRPPPPPTFSLRIDARRIKSFGSLGYEQAAGHLRRYVKMGLADSNSSGHKINDHDRSVLVAAALISLKRMRDADSVPEVVLLAKRADYQLPFDFLAASRDPRALQPMCELLSETAPKHLEKSGLSGGAARVLGQIGDPAAVPFLQGGVRCGVEQAYFPLAALGGVESMGIILESNKIQGFEAHAHGPLYWMVKRSSFATEPWMELEMVTDGHRDKTLRRKWRKWWLAHKDEMKLVRSFEEASRGWEPQWQKDEREGKVHGDKRAWLYVSGVALFLLGAVYYVRRRRASIRNPLTRPAPCD